MKTLFSKNLKFKRMKVNILSIFVILAVAFPVAGGASAQEPVLPEGFHDGMSETVDAAGCTAFGWAVDPDDRARDLQMQILADGNPVATTTANLLREDVGGCVDGTCGFSVNLFGLITAGVEHLITVQAYDEETQAWVDLSNTPKSLTCWGYPEGFHDGTEGAVDTNSCTAFGWAADPDDRDRDVRVRVLSDGVEVASLAASDYGQDMEDNGICPEGTCRFNVNLWGLISPYEEHQITIQAYDEETEGWLNLESTPKNLTCRTYDIYAYDSLTGGIKQVTNLPDSDEYNPSWSPNGKKVAHDVVDPNVSHGIYITDLKTGTSTPLAGAEDGGNDAVWSPNGKWIVFDRVPAGDSSLYLVPFSGGGRVLVRSDAVSPDWAPNGKRLVFQQPSDGSIRTVPVGDAGGVETIVAANGANPSWSPDGNWIAYESNGDIWKVQVDVHGTVLGDSIQLTIGSFEEGQPAWSADGMTIVYHSGYVNDWDLWTVPARGGMGTWLNGATNVSDYDPAFAKNSSTIAYASFSPDGQAARSWVSPYMYDPSPEYWGEGTHVYHFEAEWEGGSEITPEISFNVSVEAPFHPRYALLRPYAVRVGPECQAIDVIRPGQPTRFLSGYITDTAMTYSEALAYYDTLTARAIWDDGQTAELKRYEIIPYGDETWFNYVCTFTEAPPKMDLRVNYGHDWVESFYEAGHQVAITVTDGEGNLKATAEAFTGPRQEWQGATGFQTTPESWSPAPPDLQPYDWVYAQVDNGTTAQVQLGDIQGEVNFQTDSVTGTITADWLSEPVSVECLDWGSGEGGPNKDAGLIYTNGVDPYSCSWDPETEWDVQPWQDIGVGYLTPDGHWVANAFRDERWMAFWTYTPDPPAGLFEVGEHSYSYEWTYTAPESASGTSGPQMIAIAGDPTPIYDGFALAGPWGWDYPANFRPQQAWTGSACEAVSVLHPEQPLRFVWGWVNDYSMTYEQALDHFGSITVEVFWDDFSDGSPEDSASLARMPDLLPYTGQDARYEYLCTLTEHP